MHVESTIKAFRLAESTGYSHPWWLLVLANSAIAFMVAFVVLKDVKLYRFSPIATELGAMTYPLYLLHAHIGYVALSRASEHTKGLIAVTTFVMMLLVSWAIVRWWERPIQQRLRMYFARRRATVPTAARSEFRETRRPPTLQG